MRLIKPRNNFQNEGAVSDIDENGDNSLFRAVRAGAHVFQLEQTINLGAKWKCKNDHGHNVLHVAAEGGNVQALEYFFSLGVNVRSKDNMGETVLHRVSNAPVNFGEMLRTLVEKRLNINAEDRFGNTLLMLAIKRGRSRDEIEAIVNMKGDWRMRNRYGETVLHMAARVGNVEVLEYFVSLGADLRATDISRWTALHKVIFAKENFKETLEYLLERKLDINAVDDLQNNLVMLAVLNGMGKEGLEEIVRLGGNWAAKNVFGHFVLHAAAESGNVEALKYFIALGADVNADSNDWETPVHRLILAPQERFAECLDILMKAGALPKTERRVGKETLESMLGDNDRKEDATLVKSYKKYE